MHCIEGGRGWGGVGGKLGWLTSWKEVSITSYRSVAPAKVNPLRTWLLCTLSICLGFFERGGGIFGGGGVAASCNKYRSRSSAAPPPRSARIGSPRENMTACSSKEEAFQMRGIGSSVDGGHHGGGAGWGGGMAASLRSCSIKRCSAVREGGPGDVRPRGWGADGGIYMQHFMFMGPRPPFECLRDRGRHFHCHERGGKRGKKTHYSFVSASNRLYSAVKALGWRRKKRD